MRRFVLMGLLLVGMANAPATGRAQGSGANDAIPITLPEFRDAWALAGKMGERYTVPIKKAGDVVWYTFKLEDELVIYLQHFGQPENYASVELLNQGLETVAKPNDEDRRDELVCNAKLKPGNYFVRVTSIANNGKPFVIELSKFSKKQTEEAEREIEARRKNMPRQ